MSKRVEPATTKRYIEQRAANIRSEDETEAWRERIGDIFKGRSCGSLSQSVSVYVSTLQFTPPCVTTVREPTRQASKYLRKAAPILRLPESAAKRHQNNPKT